jgi:predicted phosphate transport protein (TIGR00153 family)
MDIGRQIDDFLDRVSESGLLFQHGVSDYLKGNRSAFSEKIEHIIDVEHQGDALRRSLEEQLYTKTLIPESRGDVLELLEAMDALLDRFKGALYRFDIEEPEIPLPFHEGFKELIACVVEAVEAMVRSSRAFFKEIYGVADHMHKVSYRETEKDKISTPQHRAIFHTDDLSLSQKMQLRDFVTHVDKIADRAEDVSDKLSIYVIKRSL